MGYEEDVNKALVVAGNQNRYQYIMVALLCLLFYFDLFLILGPSFYMMDPNFVCDGSDQIVDQAQACPKIAECHITNDYTITKYMGLYCDRQSQRDLIQSILSIGSLLGLVFMNFVADLRGRKLALIIDLILASLSCLIIVIGAYAQSTVLLCIGSIMAGFSGFSIVIVSYIIAGDICQEQLRQKSSLYMNCCYSFGLITFFFLYNWINEWYNFLILFMLLPFFGLSFIFFILMQQSPNYYLCKRNDKKKCIQALTNIAFYNDKSEKQVEEICQIIQKSKRSQDEEKAAEAKASVLTSLKQWRYLKIIIFMAIVEAGANVFFYGIQYAVNDIGFNYGVDNLVLGVTETVVTLIMTRFISSLPRKKTMLIVYLITIVLSFVFVIPAVQHSNVACTILIIGIRSSTTIGYFMIVMVQTESFPLQIQSIGAGTIQALAQLGSFSAPLLISFATNHRFEKLATLGVVLAILLVPLKFIPQPKSSLKKDELQQTLLQSNIQSQSTEHNIQ